MGPSLATLLMFFSLEGPLIPVLPFWIVLPLVLFGFFLTWLLYWPGFRAKLKPIRASKFAPALVPKKIDTIVIGTGSGGCACANLLAQSGQRVLLLEQHYRTGGCTHSFRENGCEWDTGLHYTSAAMGDKTKRPGGMMDFMSKGMQKWSRLDDPYDQIVFPEDEQVAPGNPNRSKYSFVTGKKQTVHSILRAIDPANDELRKRAETYMDLCLRINQGFTALGRKFR